MPSKKPPLINHTDDELAAHMVELTVSDSKQNKKKITKCCLANVNSVQSKDRWTRMCERIEEENFDIVFITETYLNGTVEDRMDNLNAFDLFRSDRRSSWLRSPGRKERGSGSEPRKGGVLCVAKKGILKVINLKEKTVNGKKIDDTNYENHFCEILVLYHQESNTRFILCYRPPDTDPAETEMFLEEVIERLGNNCINVILGDINYPFNFQHWEKKYNDRPWGEEAIDDADLRYFFKNSVKQLVSFKTFERGDNTLDVIIAPTGIMSEITQQPLDYVTDSDHYAITFDFKYEPGEIRAGSVAAFHRSTVVNNVDKNKFAVFEADVKIGHQKKAYEQLVRDICKSHKIECEEVYPHNPEHFPKIVFVKFANVGIRDDLVESVSRMHRDNKLFESFKKPTVYKYSNWKEKQE